MTQEERLEGKIAAELAEQVEQAELAETVEQTQTAEITMIRRLMAEMPMAVTLATRQNAVAIVQVNPKRIPSFSVGR